MNKNWLNQTTAQILNAPDGEYMFLTSDQKGDGYDIAVAPHRDDLEALRDALTAYPGISIEGMYASGALCAYRVIKYTGGLRTIRNCQHPGNWGPWYHLSLYERDEIGAPWKFVRELGRSGRGDSAYLYGRPRREEMR